MPGGGVGPNKPGLHPTTPTYHPACFSCLLPGPHRVLQWPVVGGRPPPDVPFAHCLRLTLALTLLASVPSGLHQGLPAGERRLHCQEEDQSCPQVAGPVV